MTPGEDSSSTENFRVLVERNADAMLVLDLEGRILLANPAAEALFGRPLVELLGDRFGFPLLPESVAEIEIVAAHGDSNATAELRIVEIEWEGQQAHLATLSDQTARKKAEAALDAAHNEQLDMRDQLLSQVSHELRTPLAAVQEFVALVKDEVSGEINEEQERFLSAAARNASQLGSLIDDLVEVARAQSGKLRVETQPVVLEDLLDQTVAELAWVASAAGVELSTAAQNGLPQALGDSNRSRQVLQNLIGNAIKFTAEGGSVVVSVDRDPEDADFLRVTIADDGCGIRPEGLQDIFERMHQDPSAQWKSRQGLGLGLHICRDLVRLQGGRIWAESELGKGSEFAFTLPVFSLERLLAPVLVQEDSLRSCYGLLKVVLAPPDRSRAVPESVRSAARDLVQASIYPDVDVLLPGVESMPDRCFAVLGTDQVGVESVALRVRHRLSELRDIERLGLRVYVKSWVEEIDEWDGPLEEALKAAVSRIATGVGIAIG